MSLIFKESRWLELVFFYCPVVNTFLVFLCWNRKGSNSSRCVTVGNGRLPPSQLGVGGKWKRARLRKNNSARCRPSPLGAACRWLQYHHQQSPSEQHPTSSVQSGLSLGYSLAACIPLPLQTILTDTLTAAQFGFTHSCHSSWLDCLTIFLLHPFSLNLVIFQVKWHFPQRLFSVIRIIFDSWPSYSLSFCHMGQIGKHVTPHAHRHTLNLAIPQVVNKFHSANVI